MQINFEDEHYIIRPKNIKTSKDLTSLSQLLNMITQVSCYEDHRLFDREYMNYLLKALSKYNFVAIYQYCDFNNDADRRCIEIKCYNKLKDIRDKKSPLHIYGI